MFAWRTVKPWLRRAAASWSIEPSKPTVRTDVPPIAVLRIPARRVGVEVPRLYSTYTSLDSPQQFDYSFSEASLVSPAWSEEPSPAPSPARLSPEKKRA